MYSVTRSRWLPYSPDVIYQVLTDPNKLVQIVKRIEGLTVLERDGEKGRAIAQIDLPGKKTINAEGFVEGVPGKYLTFYANEPFKLRNVWELSPEENRLTFGTRVQYSLAMDLSTIVEFWSKLILNAFLSAELDRDLERLDALTGSFVRI